MQDTPTESHGTGAGNLTAVKPAEQATAADSWTTRRLLDWMRDMFTQREIDSPRIVAEMLLSHVLNCQRMRLYMEVDRVASVDELAALRPLVARAANHEPVQYLLGQWSFFGRSFEVTPVTLIPRPSTETLVEHVLQWARKERAADTMPIDRPVAVIDRGQIQTAAMRIADICTGSGCIAVSLAAQLPMAEIIASDIDEGAIALAQRNAARHGVLSRVDFRVGDLLEPLADEAPFDVLCANPPYISDAEWQAVPPNVKEYEPTQALRGGTDGLDLVRPLIEAGSHFLQPGGLLEVEIADSQRHQAISIAQQSGTYARIAVLKDHEGLWRVLIAQRAG